MTTFRNPHYVNLDGSMIDIEFNHQTLGWIPMSITHADYPDLWEQVSQGPIAPFKENDHSLIREEWRSRAFLTRAQFCTKLWRWEILPKDQAVSAGKGDWPEAFAPVLEHLPQHINPDEAEILWSSVQNIERLHPLFEALRVWFKMTPEQADTLFGYLD